MDVFSEYSLLCFTCIRQELGKVEAGLRNSISSKSKQWEFARGTFDPKNIYNLTPRPGGAHLPHFALWQPKNAPNTTVFMANYQDGLVNFASLHLRPLALEFVNVRISIGEADEYPVFSFYYYQKGERVRVIQSLKDEPKWQFVQQGTPLSFEDVSSYRRIRVKDRFNAATIVKYLDALGWRVKEAGFWESAQPAYYGKQLRWEHSN